MAKKEDCLKINFDEYIEKINSLPARKISQLDVILSDLEEYTYDAYEYVVEPPKITAKKSIRIIEDLKALLLNVNAIMDVLCELDHESEYMDRAKDFLGTMEDEIPGLIESIS